MKAQKKYILLIFLFLFSYLNLLAQPINDDCSEAIDLGIIPYCNDDLFSNFDATPTNIGNANNGSCFIDNPPQHDVWFKFQVNTNNDIRFIINGEAGSNRKIKNIQASIYRGTCGVNSMLERNCVVGDLNKTKMEFVVNGFTIGETYYLRIDNFGGASVSGDFNICIKENNIYKLGVDSFSDKCEGVLYDSGGRDGEYSNNEDYVFTICPDGGSNSLQFEFEYYNLNLINEDEFEYDTIPDTSSKNGDFLSLYNGIDTNYSIFLEINGNAENYFEEDLIFGGGVRYENCINSECITLRFISDDSLTAEGFKFIWKCDSGFCQVLDKPKLEVNEGISSDSIISYIIKKGVEGKMSSLKCSNNAYGIFESESEDIGFSRGIILTNGLAQNAVGPDDSGKKSFALKLSGDKDLDSLSAFTIGKKWKKSHDACVIEFDIIPYGEEISYKYLFGSEEYDEFVNSKYNDIFGLFISGNGVEGKSYLNNQSNMALIPHTHDFVSINSVNGVKNWEYYHSNLAGEDLQYDGMIWDSLGNKHYLIARQKVVPCDKYHIKYAIADRADTIYDSGVFIGDLTDGRPDISLDLDYGFKYLFDNCDLINGVIKFSLPFALEKDVVFNIEITGTAKRNVDYTSDIPNTIEFKAGEIEKTFAIASIRDSLNEGIEYLVISMVRDLPCGRKELGSLSIEIHDMLDIALNEGIDTVFHCGLDSVELKSTGVNFVHWEPEEYFNNPDSSAVSFLPTKDEWIYAKGRFIDTIFNKCTAFDSIFIVNSNLDFSILGDSVRTFCFGNSEPLYVTKEYDKGEITWSPLEFIEGDNHGDSVLVNIDSSEFTVYAELNSNGCNLTDSVLLKSEKPTDLMISYEPDANIQICDTVKVTADFDLFYNYGDTVIWDLAGSYWGEELNSIYLKVGREKTIIDIELVDSIGCKTDTSIVILAEKSDILFPNAIFVNDEINKIFRPVNLNSCIDVKKFQVFNRWGEVLFDCDNEECAKQGWNAEYLGKAVKPGVYLFIFNYIDLEGRPQIIKGSFVVLN